ncbi:MAG: signal peptidase I [Clostridium sp.]
MGKIFKFLREFKWLIIFFIVLQILIVTVVPRFIIPFKVDGESMERTLQNNDLMIGKKYILDKPDHSDVVVFEAPSKDLYIKRIIGVPGDTISISGKTIYRNGQPIIEDYINPPQETNEISEIKIPNNKYFVMGDNRDNSVDSRFTEVGLVDFAQIQSKIYMRLKPNMNFGY